MNTTQNETPRQHCPHFDPGHICWVDSERSDTMTRHEMEAQEAAHPEPAGKRGPA